MSLERPNIKSDNFKSLLENIQKRPNVFIDDEFKKIIKQNINNLFPKLNDTDIVVLNILTIYIVDIISMKYSFEKTKEYYYQWTQNNQRDLKGAILLLLPFIDDKSNNYLLNNITDLNQLLYADAEKTNKIPINILYNVRSFK